MEDLCRITGLRVGKEEHRPAAVGRRQGHVGERGTRGATTRITRVRDARAGSSDAYAHALAVDHSDRDAAGKDVGAGEDGRRDRTGPRYRPELARRGGDDRRRWIVERREHERDRR